MVVITMDVHSREIVHGLFKTELKNHKNSNGNLNLNFTGELIKMMLKSELLMPLCGMVMNILEIEDVLLSQL
jgi:hypothetical protein